MPTNVSPPIITCPGKAYLNSTDPVSNIGFRWPYGMLYELWPGQDQLQQLPKQALSQMSGSSARKVAHSPGSRATPGALLPYGLYFACLFE